MELSPEDRERIEREEAKRIAEERYRQEVRDRMARQSAPPTPPPASKSSFNWTGFILSVVGVVALLAVIVVAYGSGMADGVKRRAAIDAPKPFTPAERWEPVSQRLTGDFTLGAGEYRRWVVEVPSAGVRNFRVVGHFSVFGGSGNDVQVVLARESDFMNWINGHTAQVIYGTGQTTVGDINQPLAPGTYVLAFSNKFSLLSDKQIRSAISLMYDRRE